MTIPKAAEKNSSRQPSLYCVNCGDKLGENSSAVDAFQSFVNNAPARIIVEDAIQEIYRLNNEPDFEFEDECVLCVHCCLLFSQMFGLFRLFEAKQKPGSFLASCCSQFLRNAVAGKKGNANCMDVEEADQADDFEGCTGSDGNGEKNDDERSFAADSRPPTNSFVAHSDHYEEDSSRSGAEDAEASEGTKTDADSLNNAEQAELIFKCADCSEAFKQAVQRRFHQVSAHNSREDFKCAVCKNTHLSEAVLRRHVFEHLKDAKNKSGIKCPVCHRTFSNRSALAKHKSLMHSFGPKKTLKQMTKPPKTDVTKTLKQMTKPPKTDVTKTLEQMTKPPKTDVTKTLKQMTMPPKTDVTKCGLCDKTFGNVFLLRKHRVEVHIMGQPSDDSDHAVSQSVLLIGTGMDIGHEKVSLFGPNDFLTCSDCRQQYYHKKSKSFLEHRRIMHPDRPKYQCYVCQLVFANTETLMMHIRSHNINSHPERSPPPQSEEILHKCTDCNVEYDSVVALAKHRMEGHEDLERPYKCPKCPLTYKSSQDFQNHVLYKHGDVPLPVCKECKQTFTSHRSYCKHMEDKHTTKVLTGESYHMLETNNKVMFMCLECNILEFPNEDAFLEHNINVHKREVFKCPQCPKVYRDKSSFDGHLGTHEKNPHTSDICEANFPYASHLKRHASTKHVQIPMVTPNDPPPSSQESNNIVVDNMQINEDPTIGLFRCPKCSLEFESKVSCNCHVKSTHPELLTFECEIYKKNYSKMENLRIHRKRIHQMARCEHCDYVSKFFNVHLHIRKVHKLMIAEKKITGAKNQDGHVVQKSGVYKCADCDQGYNSIVALESHRTQVHPDQEKLKCPHCPNSFPNNRSHLRIHILSHDTDKDWP